MLTVAGMLLHLVAGDLGVLVLARSLLGAGEGFFLVAALAAASDLAPPDRRGEALSFLSLSLYLGIAIGPLIGEAVLGDGDFALVWLVTAGYRGCRRRPLVPDPRDRTAGGAQASSLADVDR